VLVFHPLVDVRFKAEVPKNFEDFRIVFILYDDETLLVGVGAAGLVASTANQPGDHLANRRYWRAPTAGK
jgi:hypothetical protein